MDDTPSVAVPIQVSDPKSGTLLEAHWEIEFVAIIGAHVGDNFFLPMKSVVWTLEDAHARSTSGGLNPTKTDAKAEARCRMVPRPILQLRKRWRDTPTASCRDAWVTTADQSSSNGDPMQARRITNSVYGLAPVFAA
jgi:hypothetical protein